jgi:hypothetical protein
VQEIAIYNFTKTMVRPKASDYNLNVAAAFAKIITKYSRDPPNSLQSVECWGFLSIFDCLSSFLPQICRDLKDKYPRNWNALTIFELVKFLKKMGWEAKRKTKQVSGEAGQRPRVSLLAI